MPVRPAEGVQYDVLGARLGLPGQWCRSGVLDVIEGLGDLTGSILQRVRYGSHSPQCRQEPLVVHETAIRDCAATHVLRDGQSRALGPTLDLGEVLESPTGPTGGQWVAGSLVMAFPRIP